MDDAEFFKNIGSFTDPEYPLLTVCNPPRPLMSLLPEAEESNDAPESTSEETHLLRDFLINAFMTDKFDTDQEE